MTLRERALQAAGVLEAESGVKVRRYRSSLSGVAYTKADDWGIEVPEPTTPVRFAIFAHEVGHQVLHRAERRSRQVPRWIEEAEAWRYATDACRRFGVPLDRHVSRRVQIGVTYALAKAKRRGTTNLPTTSLLISYALGHTERSCFDGRV